MKDEPTDSELDDLEADLIVELIRDTVSKLNTVADQLETYASERERVSRIRISKEIRDD